MKKPSRKWIVIVCIAVVAAVLVEIISVLHYRRTIDLVEQEVHEDLSEEISAPIRTMHQEHLLMALLGIGVLALMLYHYARSEAKLREASQEQARINGELSAARSIQKEMLPKAFQDNIFGLLEPAREVGGDLFDFYRRDGKLFFCVGDVSGKGVPSAMLMSVIHSLFRVVSEKEESPSRILTVLNTQACRDNDTNMFVTFFVGCLDLYTGKFRYSNAGHDKPFLLSGNVSVLPIQESSATVTPVTTNLSFFPETFLSCRPRPIFLLAFFPTPFMRKSS